VPSCIFCDIAAGCGEASVVLADERCVAFLDIHPFRAGHLLVVPRPHAIRLGELDGDTADALWRTARRLSAALRASELPCDDVHLLINDGPAASQTVPHVHLHVVPRCRGDRVRMLAHLVTRPIGRVLPAAPRADLDRHAAALRSALVGSGR
jgi:histidine triad (HIT) family protein